MNTYFARLVVGMLVFVWCVGCATAEPPEEAQESTTTATSNGDTSNSTSTSNGTTATSNGVLQCQNGCEQVDEARCLNAFNIEACTLREGGCLDWVVRETCIGAQRCTTSEEGVACLESSCTNTCPEAGTTQCQEQNVATCQTGDDGCLSWSITAMCNLSCSTATGSAACDEGCSDQCENGATRCQENTVETCQASDEGCLDWSITSICTDGQNCDNSTPEASCVDGCVDACTLDTTRCNSNTVETCTPDADGCLGWTTTESCGERVCDDSSPTASCVDGCVDMCGLGDTRCQGQNIETCAANNGGCLGWETTMTCSDGQSCDDAGGDASCLDGCTDACAENDTRCQGQNIESCTPGDNGCLGWVATLSCARGTQCDISTGDAECVPNDCLDACAPNSTRCNGDTVESCTTPRVGCSVWTATVVCLESCDDTQEPAICTTPLECGPVITVENSIRLTGDSFMSDFSNDLELTDISCSTGIRAAPEAVFAIALRAGERVTATEHGAIDAVLKIQNTVCGQDNVCLVDQDLGSDERQGISYTARTDTTVFVMVSTWLEAPLVQGYDIRVYKGDMAPSAALINEISYSDPRDDDREFVELLGPANNSLAGHTLVHYGLRGRVLWAADLGALTIPDDGYAVIGDANVPNLDQDWSLLGAAGLSGGNNDDLSNDPSAVALFTGWNGTTGTLVDAVGWGDALVFLGEGQPVADLDQDNRDTSVARWPDETDTNNNSADLRRGRWPSPGYANEAEGPGGLWVTFTGTGDGPVAEHDNYPHIIPDNDDAGLTLRIANTASGGLQELQVGVIITHPYRGDLDISLTSPSGAVVVLSSAAPTGIGENLITIFDLDTAPEQPLSLLNNEVLDGSGEWRLTLIDNFSQDAGEIVDWVLWLRAN